MEDKDKKIIKKGLVQPSSDFTNGIMNSINSEEEALSTILSKHAKETPSVSFTSNLMAKIGNKVPSPYKPVISRFGWISIACTLAAIIIMILFFGQESSEGAKYQDHIKSVMETVQSFSIEIYYATYAIMAILSISLLLLIEQKVKKFISD